MRGRGRGSVCAWRVRLPYVACAGRLWRGERGDGGAAAAGRSASVRGGQVPIRPSGQVPRPRPRHSGRPRHARARDTRYTRPADSLYPQGCIRPPPPLARARRPLRRTPLTGPFRATRHRSARAACGELAPPRPPAGARLDAYHVPRPADAFGEAARFQRCLCPDPLSRRLHPPAPATLQAAPPRAPPPTFADVRAAPRSPNTDLALGALVTMTSRARTLTWRLRGKMAPASDRGSADARVRSLRGNADRPATRKNTLRAVQRCRSRSLHAAKPGDARSDKLIDAASLTADLIAASPALRSGAAAAAAAAAWKRPAGRRWGT